MKGASPAFVEATKRRQRMLLRRTAMIEAAITAAADGLLTELRQALAKEAPPAAIAKILAGVYPRIEAALGAGLYRLAVEAWSLSLATWAVGLRPRHLAKLALGEDDRLVKPKRGSQLGEDPEDAKLVFGLFRSPSKAEVARIVQRDTSAPDRVAWPERLERWSSRITDKAGLADRIAGAYSRGANIDTLTREVAPLVQNIESSARRIARTEGMRIANAMQEETFAQAEEVIDGFEYQATLDDVVRPEHAALHGKVYGKGESRPDLPSEPNCRCWYAPVLITDQPDERVIGRLGSAAASATPERQEAFAAWFDGQPVERQRDSVGSSVFASAGLVAKGRGAAAVEWRDVADALAGRAASAGVVSPAVGARLATYMPQARINLSTVAVSIAVTAASLSQAQAVLRAAEQAKIDAQQSEARALLISMTTGRPSDARRSLAATRRRRRASTAEWEARLQVVKAARLGT